jgi:hypothetical protein
MKDVRYRGTCFAIFEMCIQRTTCNEHSYCRPSSTGILDYAALVIKHAGLN